MSFVVAVVIMFIVMTGFHFVFHTLAGDESKLAKGDERQKKLARDATMTSWYCMMYWILIKMLALIPFLSSVIPVRFRSAWRGYSYRSRCRICLRLSHFLFPLFRMKFNVKERRY